METAVYNHLLTQYRPKELTKYDTHKASELRSVMNRIAKKTKTSPIYLVKLTDAKQSFALGIKESSMLLGTGLKELADTSPDGVFSKKKAYASDSEKAGVQIVNDDEEKLPDEFSLKIEHLATPQYNLGNLLYPSSGSLPGGTYKFRISVLDDMYDFQYNVGKDADNAQVMNGVASFINKANIGLNVGIVSNTSDDRVRMSIVSDATGKSGDERIFTLTDRNSDGKLGIVDYFGLNELNEESSSSKFYMDGVPKSTLANEFTIGKALKVSLKDVTDADENVRIQYRPDSEKILTSLNKIKDAYNYMIEGSNEYAKVSDKTSKLASELGYLVEPFKSEMESCGLMFEEDGTIRIDESLAVQAINDGEMQKLFSKDSDLSKRLLGKSESVKLDPMEYVDKLLVSYPNYTKEGVGYSYITSLYSGMLFNYYC